jgi:16S rRNA G966 N2-methylase RsmD
MALRPTSDRLRETLFNVLGASVEGSTFVDLFAGTGAIGIEALSRGAGCVIFVENHAAAVKLIRENLKSLGISVLMRNSKDSPQRLKPHSVPVADGTAALRTIRSGQEAVPLCNGEDSHDTVSGNAEILATDAIRGLKQFAARGGRADFVFMDPPYARAEEYERVLEFVDGGQMLETEGIVIAEHAKKIELPEKMHSLERSRMLVQGDAALSFYQARAV